MFATANGFINVSESLLLEMWQMRLVLNRTGTWVLLAAVIVLDGECCMSEEQYKNLSAKECKWVD